MFMYLAPGEAFEHTHTTQTITMLIEGEADLEIDGNRAPLTPGVPTPVDANLPHMLVNVGSQMVVAKCVHVRIGQ